MENKTKPNVITIIIWAGLGLYLASLFVKDTPKQQPEAPQASQNVQQPLETPTLTPEIFTDAAQLYAEYNANEVAADIKHKGKTLAITGQVKSIDKDFSGNIIIRLVVENQFQSIDATVQKTQEQQAATLAIGQTTQLICQGDS